MNWTKIVIHFITLMLCIYVFVGSWFVYLPSVGAQFCLVALCTYFMFFLLYVGDELSEEYEEVYLRSCSDEQLEEEYRKRFEYTKEDYDADRGDNYDIQEDVFCQN